jgi:hypothetical protein
MDMNVGCISPGPQALSRRTRREKRTIELMIGMYCRAHCSDGHAGAGPCAHCSGLLEYSLRRVENCSFGECKPTCARCTVHCFRPEMRDQVRVVMRYSGPRMAYRHPYLAARHLLDRRQGPKET